jgi:hypothetical protein
MKAARKTEASPRRRRSAHGCCQADPKENDTDVCVDRAMSAAMHSERILGSRMHPHRHVGHYVLAIGFGFSPIFVQPDANGHFTSVCVGPLEMPSKRRGGGSGCARESVIFSHAHGERTNVA